MTTEQHTEQTYKHGHIVAYKNSYIDNQNKKTSYINCSLERNGNKLILEYCNDGSIFTSVNQAVNVAKSLCNYDEELYIEQKLRDVGFINEDFFKYNSLKDTERIEIKQRIFAAKKVKPK